MPKVGIRTCAHDPLAAAPRCGVCFKALEDELAAAETLCKIYFDLAVESGWNEDALRAERDKRLAIPEET